MSLRTAGTAYFHYLTGSKEHHWWDWPALLLLGGSSWIYRKAVIMKYRSFADHEERQERLPAVVISLGNITVGGTGKTPMACMLAKELSARGWRVALLNRGYHSKREKGGASVMSDGRMVLLTAEEGGDEASLMARSLMGIPVLVGRDRAVSGRMAVEKFDAQILILDDGFQHWQLYRDVDIVLIDGTNPFGNGHVLPRGILREPLEHLSRADVFIITKVDQVTPETVAQIQEDLRRYNSSAPVALSVHKPSAVLPFLNWDQAFTRKRPCRLTLWHNRCWPYRPSAIRPLLKRPFEGPALPYPVSFALKITIITDRPISGEWLTWLPKSSVFW